MARKKYAPFCTNRECQCCYADEKPCNNFMDCCYDLDGVERCGRCGNLREDHTYNPEPKEWES